MNEIGKYGVLKEKLQGICEENDLTFSIRNNSYPFTLTVKPLGGMDAQQTMMESMDEPSGTGYISPDASLVFAYRDGDLSYKISETWTISAALFDKLKNLFKKMHFMWMQYFFRDIHEHSPSVAARSENIAEDTESAADDTENEGFDTENSDFDTPEAGNDPEVDPFDEF